MRRFIFALALTLIALPARPQTSGDMLGTWYGEVEINDTNVNFQRWMRVTRPDGTQTVTFRFYRDNRVVQERIRHDTWSFANGVYRSQCRSLAIDGSSARCDPPYEYDVQRLDSEQIEYTSRSNGKRYRMIKVRSDFKLP